MRSRSLIGIGGLLSGLCLAVPPAEAAIVRGVQKIIAGVFTLPLSVLAGTFNGPPLVGTLMGAVNGTMTSVSLLLSGTLDLAASAVQLGKAAAPYVLPFLL